MSHAKPHIVFIVADDLGFGDVSCLNPQAKINTPAHDAFARQGLTCTDGHSTSAVCTPSRYSLLTGRYAWRTRLHRGVFSGYSPSLFEPGETTLPNALQSQGYRTVCIGKWHLGLGWNTPNGPITNDPDLNDLPEVDFHEPLTAGPHTIGFEDSCILPASLDMSPYVYIENGRVIDPETHRVPGNARPLFWRPGPASRGFDHATCLLEFTRRAETTITDHARHAPDQPMFLYFAAPSPHTPHMPRPPFQGQSQAGTYGDFVVEHDWAVSRVLAALDRAGMAEDTLVVITSDNGAHMRGNGFDFEQEFGHRSNHHFRGQKSDAWDGGHRVPLLVRWPGHIKPGTTCDACVSHNDLVATAAVAAGLDLETHTDLATDGIDLAPQLAQPDGQIVDHPVVHHSIDGEFAIRHQGWKLITCPGSGGWSLPASQVPEDAPVGQLYDLQAEPEEQTNLYTQHPDRIAQLTATLAEICQA